jgi:DNA-binding NtrC family response regulator
MSKKNILIVDDDSIIRETIREALAGRAEFSVTAARDGSDAVEKLNNTFYDLVLTDMKMPGLNGIELLEKIGERMPEATVVVMTAFGTIETAVSAMKKGAFDYLTKPFSIDELEVVIDKALKHRRIVQENRYLRDEISFEYNFGNIVGTSSVMAEVYEIIAKVAASDATVLIHGESGTGKELVARAIHYNSRRKDGPFIKLNCAAISSGLLESELFGHEKGAFTNAINRKPGRFELADGGTLLLDEVSEMEFALQSKLLLVLKEGEFDRVGGVQTVKTDVRIISTTNRDLPHEIKEKTFREDLYYRLNVIPVHLPPLRSRKEDLPLLVEHFLQKYNKKNGRVISGVTADAMALLSGYDWPGNVRELENAMERAVVLSTGDVLDGESFRFLGVKPAVKKKPITVKKRTSGKR